VNCAIRPGDSPDGRRVGGVVVTPPRMIAGVDGYVVASRAKQPATRRKGRLTLLSLFSVKESFDRLDCEAHICDSHFVTYLHRIGTVDSIIAHFRCRGHYEVRIFFCPGV
jgi:hypothetical protein